MAKQIMYNGRERPACLSRLEKLLNEKNQLTIKTIYYANNYHFKRLSLSY